MRFYWFSTFCLVFIATATFGQPANWRTKISPDVLAALDSGAETDCIVIMADRPKWHEAAAQKGKLAKTQAVLSEAQRIAFASQKKVVELIRSEGAGANSLWLVNAIAVSEASPALLRKIALLPEVSRITPDPWIQFEGPVFEDSDPAVHNRSAVEWGVERIEAPAVWDQGFTGQGITIGGADTGYDWDHPALIRQYRGYYSPTDTFDHNYNWFDAIHVPSPLNGDSLNPCGFSTPFPCDDGTHGTHTMGTMAGDDGEGNQIGVAPGAQWIGCRNMERGWGRPSSYLECFQWFLAPTDVNGENAQPSKAPHVINNSWYCAEIEGCTDRSIDSLLLTAIVALKAAGVVVVVSNGNNGPNCATTFSPPAYFDASFSVGSTRFDDTVSIFSSRGPVLVDSSFRVKPNVAAPGSNIRSTRSGGGFTTLSGTSMAGPHVAGLVALLLSAVPELDGEVELIETIIETTADPKFDTTNCNGVSGISRPNHAYGYGRVNALAAVEYARQLSSILPTAPLAAISVYPNPVTRELWIDAPANLNEAVVEVFDLCGHLRLRSEWTGGALEASQLEAGVFCWRLSAGKGVWTGKFTKL